MKLITPTIAYDKQIQAYRSEFCHPGMSMDGGGSLIRFERTQDWLDYLALLSDPETVPEGKVPSRQFIYLREADEKMVGILQIRYQLNETVATYFGHIGYSVAPSERRKGYATSMLAAALPHAKAIGLDRVLITCLPDNEGSRRTILRNGGVYESTVHEPESDRQLERYWIEL